MEYHPRTNVSFAPTEPFCRRWANEAQSQMQKFKIATWEQDTTPPLEQLAQAEQHTPRPTTPPLLEEQSEDPSPALALAALSVLFLAGMAIGAYIVYRCQAK